MSNIRREGAAFWACAAITVASAAVSAAFSLAALSTPGTAAVYAEYAASRSVALLVVATGVVVWRARPALAAVAAAMTVVQALDAVIGFRLHDPAKAYGPAVLAVLTAAALAALLRSPAR